MCFRDKPRIKSRSEMAHNATQSQPNHTTANTKITLQVFSIDKLFNFYGKRTKYICFLYTLNYYLSIFIHSSLLNTRLIVHLHKFYIRDCKKVFFILTFNILNYILNIYLTFF